MIKVKKKLAEWTELLYRPGRMLKMMTDCM